MFFTAAKATGQPRWNLSRVAWLEGAAFWTPPAGLLPSCGFVAAFGLQRDAIDRDA